MGDLIEVKDTFIVQLQKRISNGQPDAFELCIIFPEYMDHDNETVWYRYERDALDDLGDIIRSAGEIISRDLF